MEYGSNCLDILHFTMDKSFTDYIRSTVDADGEYYGPLFTEDEVDRLFDWPEEKNPSYPTDAVEELVLRTSGIRVDLAPQNAAVLAVGKSRVAVTSSFNTIAVRDTEGVQRTYSVDHPDTKHVTPVSKDDANEAVRSIDFPQSRPSGTPLDALRLDMRDNPAETCLSNALTTVQFMSIIGADISDLCKCIDTVFGINYSKRLIESSAFAAAEDIETFVASGGRPAPATYISPNIMTRYVAYHTPRYTSETMNTSSMFMGRCIELCKFISAFTNFVHGRKYIKDFCFEVNPSGFSKFSPATLDGYKCSITEVVSSNRLASTITSKRTYDDFIKARQPARVALLAEKKSIMDTVTAIKMSMPKLEWKDDISLRKEEDIMTSGMVSEVAAKIAESESDPKRISARFLHFAHMDHSKKDVHDLLSMNAAVSGFVVFASLGCQTPEAITSFWSDSCDTQEFKRAMNHVDTVSCYNIKEVYQSMVESSDPYRVARVWLAVRHVLHTRMSIISAYNAVKDAKDPMQLPTKMKHRKDLYICGKIRLYKAIEVYLQVISKVAPFKYKTSMNSSANKSRYGVSLLSTSTGMLANIEESWKRWDEAKKMVKSTGKDIGGLRAKKQERNERNFKMKHLFANCRSKWVNYYCRKYRFIKKQIVTLSNVTGCGINKLIRSVGSNYSSDKDTINVAASLVIEMLIEIGKALAFRFYHVTVKDIPIGKTIVEAIEEYKQWLVDTDVADIPGKLSVEPKEDQAHKNSALHCAICGSLNEALDVKQCGQNAYTMAREVVLESYVNSKNIVARAFAESLEIDKEFLMTGTVECKPKARVSKWDTKSMADAKKVAKIDKVLTVDIFSHLKDHPKVLEARGGIRLGLGVAGQYDPNMRKKLEFIANSQDLTVEIVESHAKEFEGLARKLDLVEQTGPALFEVILGQSSLAFIDKIYKALGGSDNNNGVIMQG